MATQRIVRRAVLVVAIFGLMLVSFAAGRLTINSNRLPAIVATLPGDESEFSHELDERIRERFPVGTSEDKLLEFLADQKFTSEWRRRDDPNAAVFLHQGLLCGQMVHILWRDDAAGILTEVRGRYQSSCGPGTFSGR
jgi:hypothetical protein